MDGGQARHRNGPDGWRDPARVAAVALLFCALTAVVLWPQFQNLTGTVGSHQDALFSVWRLAWVAHQIVRAPGQLFDANIFFPEPRTFAYSDALLLPGLMAAPLAWAGVPPVLIYNLVLLGTFVAGGVAVAFLVRYLTGSLAAGLVAGTCFAFCTHRIEHFDRLEMLGSFWMPLTLLALHKAHDGPHRGRYFVLAGILASAQMLTGIYHGIFFLTYLALFVPLLFAATPRRVPGAVAAAVVLPALVLATYSLPYLANRDRVGERLRDETTTYSALPGDFLVSHPNNRLYGPFTPRPEHAERHLFPGALAVFLAGLGLVRRWQPWTLLAYLAGLLLGIELALGFNSWLYPWFYDHVLPYRGLRVPARAYVLVSLSLSVFVGYGAARVLATQRSARARVALCGVLLAVAIAEYRAAPVLRRVERPSPWYDWLAQQPPGPVFEWPVSTPGRLDINEDVVYMFNGTRHWFPLLNGYSGFYPQRYLTLLDRMRSFPDAESLDYLRARDVCYVIVHGEGPNDPRFSNAIARLMEQPGVIMLAHERVAQVAFLRLK